jgi:hypothetical protein
MKRKEKKRKSTPRYVLWRTWMLWKTENFPQWGRKTPRQPPTNRKWRLRNFFFIEI